VQEAWAERVVQVVRAAAVVPLAVKRAWAARAARAEARAAAQAALATEAVPAAPEAVPAVVRSELPAVRSESSVPAVRRGAQAVPAAQEIPAVASAPVVPGAEAAAERATDDAVQ
jgi:hypothetical protein